MKYIKQKMNKGFVVLFSILISSIILLISTGIYEVVQKQVVLSSYARESQKAFYAADAALDCALFNDISPILSGITSFPLGAPLLYSKNIECGGGTTQVRLLSGITTGEYADYTSSFVFRYYGVRDDAGLHIGSGCAYVLVEKKGELGVEIDTRITAAGFNVCKDGFNTNKYNVTDFADPMLLERRISINYKTI